MDNLLREIKQNRIILKKNRSKFWNKNKKNFKNNILKIIKTQKLPKKWKIYIIASSFISNKKIFPYDYDSWSMTDIIAGTKKQGFEIMMFFNRARAEFLSISALNRIVIHEIEHIRQIDKSPKKFLMSIITDKPSKELEHKADAKVNEKSIEEYALETILYCYDMGSWTSAQKMVAFLLKGRELYGGGYKRELTKEQHNAFLKAKRNNDINIFIDCFK